MGWFITPHSTMHARKSLKPHPGPCHSCVLCGKSEYYFTHTINWSEHQLGWLQQHSSFTIEENSCICKTCGDDVKRNIGNEQYVPRWLKSSTTNNHPKALCSVLHCENESTRNLKATEVAALSKNGERNS